MQVAWQGFEPRCPAPELLLTVAHTAFQIIYVQDVNVPCPPVYSECPRARGPVSLVPCPTVGALNRVWTQ